MTRPEIIEEADRKLHPLLETSLLAAERDMLAAALTHLRCLRHSLQKRNADHHQKYHADTELKAVA